jgi:dipeptidyl-peptidase-4
MSELTVERLFSDPPLAGGLPSEPRFTPDGSGVAFLRVAADDRECMDLWRHDIDSGENRLWIPGARLSAVSAPLTDAEKAERERKRQFNRGITRYLFSPDGARLLLPVDGAGYLLDLRDDTLANITPAETRQTDFQFDPAGARISYVRAGDLYLTTLATGIETRLTDDGGGSVSNGIAEFIAQEEMHRFEGHWWSPDGRFLAYTRVDEAPIAESQRYEIDADRIQVINQHYPYAGATNADVALRVRDLASGQVTDIHWRLADDDYLARVGWWGERLVIQRQSRDQQQLTLVAIDPGDQSREILLTETSKTWINLHDNFRGIDAERFLWTSERSGHGQLYLWQQGELRPLTAGEGRVNRILWADDASTLILGWFGNPTEQHVYRARLQVETPALPERITTSAGWHEAVASSDGARLLDRSTALSAPGALRLLSLANGSVPAPDACPAAIIAAEMIGPAHPYFSYRDRHATPELGIIRADDGQLLHYRLTRPVNGPRPARGHPVIVYVYGGPGVQRVRNEWPPLLLQLFNHRGYGVLELDNRGTGNRGPGFEAPVYRRLGDVEVKDQLRGVEMLCNLDWVDPTRIGVFGHSYGGYMAIMCLLQASAVFRAAVAVAPVTDWRLYDTHYTERYLSTPAENPDGYAASSVFPYVGGLRGKLLLIHGMADDNVLFTHSTRLYRALQAGNLPFEMMAYPGAKHALQERDVSIHRVNLILDFFGRSL